MCKPLAMVPAGRYRVHEYRRWLAGASSRDGGRRGVEGERRRRGRTNDHSVGVRELAAFTLRTAAPKDEIEAAATTHVSSAHVVGLARLRVWGGRQT